MVTLAFSPWSTWEKSPECTRIPLVYQSRPQILFFPNSSNILRIYSRVFRNWYGYSSNIPMQSELVKLRKDGNTAGSCINPSYIRNWLLTHVLASVHSLNYCREKVCIPTQWRFAKVRKMMRLTFGVDIWGVTGAVVGFVFRSALYSLQVLRAFACGRKHVLSDLWIKTRRTTAVGCSGRAGGVAAHWR